MPGVLPIPNRYLRYQNQRWVGVGKSFPKSTQLGWVGGNFHITCISVFLSRVCPFQVVRCNVSIEENVVTTFIIKSLVGCVLSYSFH